MNVRGLTTLALAGALLVTASAAPLAQGLQERQLEQARQMLDDLREAVERYYYDPSYRGIDLDAHFGAASRQLESAQSVAHAQGIIAQTLIAFEDSHTFFVPPAATAAVDYGWTMRMIGDRCYIVSVEEGSDASAKGIRPGDELLRVDQFTPRRDDLWKLRYLLYGLSPRTLVKLTVRPPGGEPRQVDVAAAVTPRPPVVRIHRQQLQGLLWRQARSTRDARNEMSRDGDIAIWRLSGFDFDYRDVGRLFEEATAGASGLILDMRGNGGGLIRTMQEIAGRLFDRDVTIATIRERGASRALEAKKKRGAFTGAVIALLDADSGSSAELLGRVLQLEGRGIVIGDRSAGHVQQARRVRLGVRARGGAILYSASIATGTLTMSDGATLEGVGVTPDELLLPSAEDLAAGRDPVLARAVQRLGGGQGGYGGYRGGGGVGWVATVRSPSANGKQE